MTGRHRAPRRARLVRWVLTAAMAGVVLVFGGVALFGADTAPARFAVSGPSTTYVPPPIRSAPAAPDELAAMPSRAARFADCAQARAAGVSLIPMDDPRYRRSLDRDGDGVACDRRGDTPAATSTGHTVGSTPSMGD